MEKSKPLNIYSVYLYCDKCGGLMKAIDSLAGTGTHSLGYNYCCEQCGTIVTSFIKYPYIMIEEMESDINISSERRDTEIPSTVANAFPVGGTIFYIDDTADGKYQFFDIDGNVMRNVRVGDRPYYYKVIEKGSKDKYYVYHDEVYDDLRWTYFKDNNHVYKSLGTSSDRGSGKTNTEMVMAEDYGAYIAKDSKGYSTIWYQLQQVRNAEVGGCNDWFVPSAYEVNELRSVIKSGKITGGKIAGSSYDKSVFSKKWLWSSSDYSAKYSWYWGFSSQSWCYSYKHYHNSVFFTRAF